MVNEIRASDPEDSIKNVIRSSMLTPESDKIYMKNVRGHIGQNIV